MSGREQDVKLTYDEEYTKETQGQLTQFPVGEFVA